MGRGWDAGAARVARWCEGGDGGAARRREEGVDCGWRGVIGERGKRKGGQQYKPLILSG
jgi:hypothetical protein